MGRSKSKLLSGGLRDIDYSKDTDPVVDNEHSLAFKEELEKWKSNPRKYWWEHGGKIKVRNISIVIIIAVLVLYLILYLL